MSEKEFPISVFKATDWGHFTGNIYMPALEQIADQKTARRHELPTFYDIAESIVLFHPKLDEPLLLIAGDSTVTLTHINKSIEDVFHEDKQFDYCKSNPKPLVRYGYSKPRFISQEPGKNEKNFFVFLREVAARPNSFEIIKICEQVLYTHYFNDCNQLKFLKRASHLTELSRDALRAYLKYRTKRGKHFDYLFKNLNQFNHLRMSLDI